MLRLWASFLALLILAIVSTQPARAEKRVALVIGNNDYSNLGAYGQLLKAVNDAQAVGDALEKLGFKVIRGANLGRQGMIDKLAELTAQLEPGDTASFFYAGHGVAIDGVNYLVPTDVPAVKGEAAAEVRVRGAAIPEGYVVAELQAKGVRVALLVLDACRDNPFPRTGTRSIGNARGLAEIKPARSVFTIYSAGIGQTALDQLEPGDPNRNSVFTRIFVEELGKPGVDLAGLAIEVREQVARLAHQARDDLGQSKPHEQTPAYYDQTLGRFYLNLGTAPPPKDPEDVRRRQLLDAAAQTWAAVKDTKSVAVLEEFIRQFGETIYGTLARERLEELTKAPPPDITPPGKLATAPPVPSDPCTVTASRSSLPCRLSAAQERALKPKDTFKECAGCPEMVVVPAGSFIMGSPADEPQRGDEEGPPHKVTFAHPFAVGRFAVTFDEWDVCVNDGGCDYHPADEKNWGRGRRPAVNISWNDAQAYVKWLSRRTGKNYRLLSEAEREYVTRAGTVTAFWTGATISTKNANYNGNFVYRGGTTGDNRAMTLPVDSFAANPWGLYQVHGNVWEWVEDCWHEDYNDAPTDGSVWSGGDCSFHLLRGGSWFVDPRSIRSAARLGYSTDNRNGNDAGFRVARTLDEQTQTAGVAPPAKLPTVPPLSLDPCGDGAVAASRSLRPCALSAVQERALKPKDTFKECGACPEMVVVPAGSFMMGSPANELQRNNTEGPQHRVTFAKPFAVGRFSVTFDEWAACVSDGGCAHQPSDEKNWGRDRRPVINVSWNDAKGYVAWLSRKTGKDYRLLSEAEREYVTRAGTTTVFWTGATISTKDANYNGNFTYGGGPKGDNRLMTLPVDKLASNPWGLFHVHGNTWEWVEDCWHANYDGAPTDGSVWDGGDCAYHLMRGGSWFVTPRDLRAAARLGWSSGARQNSIGFRVARTLAR